MAQFTGSTEIQDDRQVPFAWDEQNGSVDEATVNSHERFSEEDDEMSTHNESDGCSEEDVDSAYETAGPEQDSSEEPVGEDDLIRQHDLLRVKGFVNGHPARILIDPGSTHDIISDHFVDEAEVEISVSSKYMTVKSYDGEEKKVPRKKSKGQIQMQLGTFMDARRMIVAQTEPDIILGKPWLTRHNPHINWRKNEIIIGEHTIEATEGSHRGEVTIQTVTAGQATRMFRKNNIAEMYVVVVQPTSESSAPGSESTTEQLTPTQHKQLSNVLDKFKSNVFSEPEGLPPKRAADHRIELIPGSSPPSRSPYRLSQPELDELRKQLAKLIEEGWIRPSVSPFGAPILFVKKKSGDLRMCVDYRALNKITIKNRYPLPNIAELLDRLAGAKYFTSLDLRSGYHQLRIAEEDVPKTAFNTRYGHYEYTVMPFGLTNAPASFQALMNDVLRPYLDKFVVVYLDDILIYSNTWEEHLEHLNTVFTALRDNQLHCAAEKCQFAQREIDYLGFIVSEQGVRTNPKKTAAITEWPEPKSIADVQTFMGLANWFHKHIPKFADISTPLTDLLRADTTDKEFQMTESAREAFNTLKQRMTNTPILALPDFGKPFRVTTDASKYAAGMMLSQLDAHGRERPIAFESRKFRDHEKNWSTPDKELAAVVHALTIWRQYLDGQQVLVFTDHQALKHIQQQPKLNQRQARWLDLVQSYDLDIQHMPGRLNKIADALSRRPDYAMNINQIFITVTTVITTMVTPKFQRQIQQGYDKDPYFNNMYRSVQQGTDPTLTRKYTICKGLLYLQDGDTQRLCIPDIPEVKLQLLEENHDKATAGHLGYDKTYQTMARYYWWPNMSKMVKHFVASCDYCQRTKASNKSPAGFLMPVAIPQERWEVVTIDFITGLPKTAQGYDMITTFTDKLSKRMHLAPGQTTADARDIANQYFGTVFRHHGIPRTIICDRDSKFNSKFWQHLMQLLGTRMAMSTANHPQADGQSERTNRTVEDMLRCLVNYDQNNWDELLPAIEFAYNNQVNAATKETPFYADTGRHPRLPQDILTDPAKLQGPNEAANELAARMAGIVLLTRDHMQHAQDRQAKYYNSGRRDTEFRVGDKVLVDMTYLQTPEQRAREKEKLKFKRSGPYKIIEKLGPLTYRVELPKSCRAHNVFNIAALTPYNENTLPGRVPVTAPPQIQDDGTEEWKVAKILRHQNRGRGRWYLTVWEGERDIDATWQSRRDFMDNGKVTNRVLLQYEKRHGLG